MTATGDADHDFDEMKLAIFDLDGTLTDSTAIDSACFVEAFDRAYELNASTTDWSGYRHHSDRGLTREFLLRAWEREPDEQAIVRHRAIFLSLLETRMLRLDEIGGARAFLGLLRQRHWDVAIATGGWSQAARMKLQRAGFESTLPLACCDAAESRDDIVRQAIGGCRDCVVVFGDGPWDVRTARNLSLPFVGVGSGSAAEALRHAGAPEVVRDFSDADGVLQAMERAGVPMR